MSRFKIILVAAIGVFAPLAALGAAGGAMAQNATSGAQVFATKCQACHSVDRTRGSAMAPNLAGVVGRKAGTLPKFFYSPAMTRSNIVWNASSLDAFLTAPQRVVRGTRMSFTGISNAKERADVIAFLSSKK